MADNLLRDDRDARGGEIKRPVRSDEFDLKGDTKSSVLSIWVRLTAEMTILVIVGELSGFAAGFIGRPFVSWAVYWPYTLVAFFGLSGLLRYFASEALALRPKKKNPAQNPAFE